MKQRVPETNEGIQGEFDVNVFNKFQRDMRDRGWIETSKIIASGIQKGHALEVGPGPGYLGLEWLKNTADTQLTGLEISANMIMIAQKNAKEYGFDSKRVKYVKGNAMSMPFDASQFDAAFSNGSLHEWERPDDVLCEIARVLKPEGRFFISDLRRDSSPLVKWFLSLSTQKKMKAGLKTSLQASYTKRELEKILEATPLCGAIVRGNAIGLSVSGSLV
jgi:ubiquinone/menaquinone biosynthesis C-methylase UbiE